MRTYGTIGITLTVKKYRGTERLVAFYTREQGKVEAVAKGIGKPGSKLAALVEPLTLSKLFFAKGRKLDYLTQGEVIDSFYELHRPAYRYGYACYLAELTAGATEPSLANPSLFEALKASLTAMEEADDPQIIGWAYCLKLLTELGLAPVLDRCVICEGPLADWAVYQPAAGGLVCNNCQTISETEHLVSGATRGALTSLLAMPADRLGRLRISAQSRRQITDLLREHIAYHLGLRPKSEQFLADLSRSTRQTEQRK